MHAKKTSTKYAGGGGGPGRREKRAKQQRNPHTSFPFCAGVQFSREFISAFDHQIEIQEKIEVREQPKLNLVEQHISSIAFDNNISPRHVSSITSVQ